MRENQSFEHWQKWFESYLKRFHYPQPKEDRVFQLKKNHTFRVVEEITSLGIQLGLSGRDLELARIIGLFHDIGRFEQFRNYKTWSDLASVDHASSGIRILHSEGVYGNFSKEEGNILVFAIAHHNKSKPPENKDSKRQFYAKILRDADKLDVLRVICNIYGEEDLVKSGPSGFELSREPTLSHRVSQAVERKQPVSIDDLKTTADLKIFYAAWVFDMNFRPALQALKDRNYLSSLRSDLPKSRELHRVFEIIDAYLDQKLNHTKQ